MPLTEAAGVNVVLVLLTLVTALTADVDSTPARPSGPITLKIDRPGHVTVAR